MGILQLTRAGTGRSPTQDVIPSGIEDLYTMVEIIGNIGIPVCIKRNRRRSVELTDIRATAAEGQQVTAGSIKLLNSITAKPLTKKSLKTISDGQPNF